MTTSLPLPLGEGWGEGFFRLACGEGRSDGIFPSAWRELQGDGISPISLGSASRSGLLLLSPRESVKARTFLPLPLGEGRGEGERHRHPHSPGTLSTTRTCEPRWSTPLF